MSKFVSNLKIKIVFTSQWNILFNYVLFVNV